jgi:GNAT superfamily N-acetyltransferase
MLADSNYHFLLAIQDGLAVGFAIVRVLNAGSAALLEYMAVSPSHRGRGIGRKIFIATTHALNAPPLIFLIEVESDREQFPDRALRTGRKNFYRSFGAREISNLNWIMPPVHASLPPAMELMTLGLTASSVSKNQLRKWLTLIYIEVYGQAQIDSRIHEMITNLPNEIQLV